MKNLLILLCFISIAGSAQEVKPLLFSEVVAVDSVTASELYQRAETWFTTSYKNATKVLDLRDKENGQLIGKAAFEHTCTKRFGVQFNGYIHYTISVVVKDNRYKLVITNFDHKGRKTSQYDPFFLGIVTTSTQLPMKAPFGYSEKLCTEIWDEVKASCEFEYRTISESLKSAMTKPTDSQNSDW